MRPALLVVCFFILGAGQLYCVPRPVGKRVQENDSPDERRSSEKPPEVWMSAFRVNLPGQLLDENARWTFVKERLDGYKFHLLRIDQPKGSAWPWPVYEDPAFGRLVGLFARNDIRMGVEIGLYYHEQHDQIGERNAKMFLQRIERLYDAGGRLAFIDIDGPVRRLRYKILMKTLNGEQVRDHERGVPSYEVAAREIADFIRIVKAEHPEVAVYHLVNFPNWGWKGKQAYQNPFWQEEQVPWQGSAMGYGDFYDALNAVIEVTREQGAPIDGVTVDHPYEYAIGSIENAGTVPESPRTVGWIERLRELERLVKGKGLRYSHIFNSETGGRRSARSFQAATLAYVRKYRQEGGRPDLYMVQSWYPHPKAVVPETGDYTMTSVVKEVFKRFFAP